MAWTSNGVSIGDPTKKSHYDNLWNNAAYNKNTTTGDFTAVIIGTGLTGTTIYHADDTNTGIGFPAADTLLLSTGGVNSIRMDSLQNVGFGVTPNVWQSVYSALNIGGNGTMFAETTAGASKAFWITQNMYRNTGGSLTYISTDEASYYLQVNGSHIFSTAGSGTADTTATFGQKLLIANTGELATGGESSPDVDDGGLCLNHGASDGNILTFKNSDVAHGMTGLAEADTYGFFRKESPTQGGVNLASFTEGNEALNMNSYATTEDTTDTSSSIANTMVTARLKSGSGASSHGNTGNIFAVRNAALARFLIKGNGDIHATNTTITALDDKNDAEAVRDLTYHLAPKQWLSRALRYNKQDLHDMGVITWTQHEDKEDDIMMSFQGMFGLYGGAIGELHGVVNLLTDKLKKVGIDTNYNKLRKEFRDNQPALLN